MIYDEGWELRLNGIKYFAWCRYEQRDGSGIVSLCHETANGMFHKDDGTAWGCWYGTRDGQPAGVAASFRSIARLRGRQTPRGRVDPKLRNGHLWVESVETPMPPRGPVPNPPPPSICRRKNPEKKRSGLGEERWRPSAVVPGR